MLQDICKGTKDATDILNEWPEMVNEGCEGQVEYHCRATE